MNKRYVYLLTCTDDGWHRQTLGIYSSKETAEALKNKVEAANKEWLKICEGCSGMTEESPYWRNNCREKEREIFKGLPSSDNGCSRVLLDSLSVDKEELID